MIIASITFGDEVERIWKRQITGASVLFLLNRYLTPIQFGFEIDAFNNPRWSTYSNVLKGFSCDRVVAFEGYATVALVTVCELIMILRVFALYGRNYWILSFLLALLAGHVIISSYGLSVGMRAPLTAGFVGCIFTGPPRETLFPAIWYAPVVVDFIIFGFTLHRTMKYSRALGSSTPLLRQFTRDGVLYFAIIFSANMINVLVYELAVQDLKAIGASFSQMITSVMISRLVLNLRGVIDEEPTSPRPGNNVHYRQGIVTRAVGNLGGDFGRWDTSSDFGKGVSVS
ncbi:hypothetical protein E1B28_000206 [Marasmius oreades]|uniref:DUF6533 domain-containing protein n=1 Tax=Marasmius oreades TaxID=181124 RepID=A0A9P7V0Z6_9AGAR|nr:uncharacterized protein E1B28_000206 [Marasmius oreades]KAG7098242.1 hypothetical protein E1B28_000206 [Marasmius oreades]